MQTIIEKPQSEGFEKDLWNIQAKIRAQIQITFGLHHLSMSGTVLHMNSSHNLMEQVYRFNTSVWFIDLIQEREGQGLNQVFNVEDVKVVLTSRQISFHASFHESMSQHGFIQDIRYLHYVLSSPNNEVLLVFFPHQV